MNSDSKHYQDKYIKLATEFWNLQQVDKTEEEVEELLELYWKL